MPGSGGGWVSMATHLRPAPLENLVKPRGLFLPLQNKDWLWGGFAVTPTVHTLIWD
ncbi:hypothetical protein COCON_G00184880 [Conger conger]|uniref:Uncharacterized protein n=1 Tax=Conger conger TaxID=82655 RepID=A0A9Q1HPS9_CONCO|nr:hypothetical protein COCON_G00184880 [Conger conger]